MAKTQDPQNGEQDAIKDNPAEADNIKEIIMEAAHAVMSGAPESDSRMQRAIEMLSRSHAEEIIKAAQAAINDEPHAERKLQWIITQFLNRNCEELITQAQENAGTPEVADKIGETARLVAINAFEHAPGNEEGQQFTLVAIPLLLTLPYDEYKEAPRALSKEDTDWLAQAFDTHGLADPANERFLFAPQL